MTNITDQDTLDQFLLNYLKLRWTNQVPQAVNPKADFLTWLASNGNAIDGPTTNTLNGYAYITSVTITNDVSQFAMANLAADGETMVSYLVRFQYEQLGMMGGGSIIDDASAATILGHQSIVTSGAVGPIWNGWFPSDPANAGRTFPQQLAAFKASLLPNRVLTGEAVGAIAAAVGFNYGAWQLNQYAGVLGAPAGNVLSIPKIDEAAACWSWALNGFGPMAITPDDIFTWLHAPHATAEPAVLAAVAGGAANHQQARQLIHQQRATMHAQGLALMAANYDQNWAANPAKVTAVGQINHAVYAALVELYGFTVQPNPTGTAVAIEYRNTDGVSWEHWWVEHNGILTETFPRMRFSLQLTNQTQVQRMGPGAGANYTIVRIPVTGLQQRHLNVLGAGMAQYL
jgi:hypothetical protein